METTGALGCIEFKPTRALNPKERCATASHENKSGSAHRLSDAATGTRVPPRRFFVPQRGSVDQN